MLKMVLAAALLIGMSGFRLLQNNNITGVIPAELGNLPRLKTVDLSDNKLTGEVPASLAQIESLQYL